MPVYNSNWQTKVGGFYVQICSSKFHFKFVPADKMSAGLDLWEKIAIAHLVHLLRNFVPTAHTEYFPREYRMMINKLLIY